MALHPGLVTVDVITAGRVPANGHVQPPCLPFPTPHTQSETNNYEFFVYGSWDSFEDYMDHLHSDHLHKLLDFNKENDIAWFLAPVKHY
jgi:hypothetical protein